MDTRVSGGEQTEVQKKKRRPLSGEDRAFNSAVSDYKAKLLGRKGGKIESESGNDTAPKSAKFVKSSARWFE